MMTMLSIGHSPKYGEMLKIDIADLLVVCEIRSLEAFVLLDAFVLNLANGNMHTLSQHLPPVMRVLHLNHHPFLVSKPKATIHCLAFFAQNCQNLVELAICVNATVDEESNMGLCSLLHVPEVGSWEILITQTRKMCSPAVSRKIFGAFIFLRRKCLYVPE